MPLFPAVCLARRPCFGLVIVGGDPRLGKFAERLHFGEETRRAGKVEGGTSELRVTSVEQSNEDPLRTGRVTSVTKKVWGAIDERLWRDDANIRLATMETRCQHTCG